ncbi:MAG: DctP family TRAP transporter solute-binding subunit [Clostridiales Family XIII bacterium]|jgi:tripartite ATP-independent transporter DctP family solute receptor|nr:DctP family TRAP transporter solute-binding subunit [Clostridiales Family XIII bacterium]
MKKKLIVLMVLALVVVTAFAGCRPSDSADSAQNDEPVASEETTDEGTSDANTAAAEVTIMLSHEVSDTHPSHIALTEVFKTMVEEGTEGRVKVDVYPNSQLGTMQEVLEHIMAGQNEAIVSGETALVSTVPEYSLVGLPFLFNDLDSAHAALDGEFGDFLNGKLAEKGVVNLAWGDVGFRDITNSKRAIKTVADLKGLKIRTQQNDLHIEYFKDLGSLPTPMNFSELFTALQQGTVDGQENPIMMISTNKLYEAQKYLTISDHIYAATNLCISKTVLESLSEADQQVLYDAAAAAMKQQREQLQAQTEDGLNEIKSAGVEVNELSAEEKEAFKKIAVDGCWKTAEETFGKDNIDLAQSFNK